MAVFKCKMCGGALEINNETVATCEYCGTQQTLPKLNDDHKANLYDRANHFRRNNEFDKAMGMYEKILNDDSTDAEAYWSLVLCRYGIEYVEDPASHKRIPTVNRAQFTSVFDDNNYKSALQYADVYQRSIYEEEARTINEIQKGILAISQKEEPFDVFICYKDTDKNGRRTPDSVLANDLYHQLTQEGFKVFFSRITLEDKLGTAYEPYIFAALNSARVMVVLGTKPEYFNAVWVKNEWSRYLSLIKNGEKKILIPAYKDMDPYDLPEEFSHLQAQDMSKLGFMQDLIRGIRKIVQTDEPKSVVVKETAVISGNVTTASLLERVSIFLEDGDFSSADEYCEKVLDLEAKCAEAYLGKLMAQLRVKFRADLQNCADSFKDNSNYQKAIRFGDDKLRSELTGYIERNERNRIEGIYNKAVSTMSRAEYELDFKKAAQLFDSIPDYKDSADLAKECYKRVEQCRKELELQAEIERKDNALENGKLLMYRNTVSACEEAIEQFKSIPGWKDADELVVECQNKIKTINEEEENEAQKLKKVRKAVIVGASVFAVVTTLLFIITVVIIPTVKYKDAVALMDEGKYPEAASAFESLGRYKDSPELMMNANYKQAEVLLEDGEKTKAAMMFGKASGYKDAKQRSFALWDEIVEKETISAGSGHSVGLKSNGGVVADGYNHHDQCDVTSWTNVVAVSAGSDHTTGLKADGSVVANGDNDYGQCNVSAWTDIIAISAGNWHTAGLRSDGTVVAVGKNSYSQCAVADWTDIVAVAAGGYHTAGLRPDGTVVAVGYNSAGQCDVSDWTDIIAISAGDFHTVGLRSDGTVVAVGDNDSGRCDVSDWTDIIAISAGDRHTVGLRSDGTVVAVGNNSNDQCDVADWTDIVAVAAGGRHTVGLRSDGSVVAVGDRCSWKEIKIPTK